MGAANLRLRPIVWLTLLYVAGSSVSNTLDPLEIRASAFAWPTPVALALPRAFAVFSVAADFVPARVSFP